jgi:uncharacterized protein YgiM (DUF1202 family)
MVIGALAAFLLLGPLPQLFKTQHVAAGRPQSSSSPSSNSTPCNVAGTPPAGATPAASPSKPTLPASIWVNDPLGVNMRETAGTSGKLIATLSQGTQASADSQSVDTAGNPWYHVTVGSQAGWVRADFMATYALRLAIGDGWSLMLPSDLTQNQISTSLFEATRTAEVVPFLRARTSSAEITTIDLPKAIRPDPAPIYDHNKLIQVWSYTVLERVSRVAIDRCQLRAAAARPDQGWPYMTVVTVKSSQRSYQFEFFTAEPDSAVVTQVLNSAALS